MQIVKKILYVKLTDRKLSPILFYVPVQLITVNGFSHLHSNENYLTKFISLSVTSLLLSLWVVHCGLWCALCVWQEFQVFKKWMFNSEHGWLTETINSFMNNKKSLRRIKMRVCPSNKSHLMSVIINLSLALLSLPLDPIIITGLYFLENYANKIRFKRYKNHLFRFAILN